MEIVIHSRKTMPYINCGLRFAIIDYYHLIILLIVNCVSTKDNKGKIVFFELIENLTMEFGDTTEDDKGIVKDRKKNAIS